MEKLRGKWKENWKEWSFVLGMFAIFLIWAAVLPFDSAPDEAMRFQIPAYILNYGRLPNGADPLIRDGQWGISYGFGPPLAAIVSAAFMKVMGLFSKTDEAFRYACRIVSALCGAGVVGMTILIGKKRFAKEERVFFVALVAFLPQFVFLSSYINNDAMALLGTAVIVYAWICGLESQWNRRSCVMLALGIVVCTLTYYNSYGFILCSILLFIISVLYQKQGISGLLKKGLLISVIVIGLAGWYFVRNYMLYDGDFLGMATSTKYAELYAVPSLKPSMRHTPMNDGLSLFEMLKDGQWFQVFYKSFIGTFGYMEILLPNWAYTFYTDLFWLASIGGIWYLFDWIRAGKSGRKQERQKRTWEWRLFDAMMVISAVIPNLLNLWYSYSSDYEPQGRYSMPMLVPLMYFVTKGLFFLKKKLLKEQMQKKTIRFFIILLGVIVIWSLVGTIIPYYYG
ncbi:MAG: DUF2142 domain-containing protein [Lachnospiraceae bacterium]|nr:DUF2142 domain-containing protein [Robinsoniella sp.]MDY3765218.1 DUF2142 domain-containing protein [Lachnospiraceae bacterium]